MRGDSIIDRILNAIDEAAKDYGEWSAWGSSSNGHKPHADEPCRRWDAESDIAARVILQYLAKRGMEVKELSNSPDATWIHIEKRNSKKTE